MLKITCRLAAVILPAVISITSCTNSGSGKGFQTKEDSVRFAKSVYKLYPNDVTDGVKDTVWEPGGTNGVHPIPWDTVIAYQEYYDKEPKLFDLQKQPYKGFGVDPNGYSWMMANKDIKGWYLRLGRKGDGAYTMMLLGTDSAGNILQKKAASVNREGSGADNEPSNFDNTIPCPNNCPDDDN